MEKNKILCMCPHTDGLAIVVMKNPIDVSIRKIVKITPVSNREAMKHIKKFIALYQPQVVVTESPKCKAKRKGKRITTLLRLIEKHCQQNDISVVQYSKNEIDTVFSLWNAKTRYERAEIIAGCVKGFKHFLFDPPKYPKTEHYYSPLFDAVALGITHFYQNE